MREKVLTQLRKEMKKIIKNKSIVMIKIESKADKNKTFDYYDIMNKNDFEKNKVLEDDGSSVSFMCESFDILSVEYANGEYFAHEYDAYTPCHLYKYHFQDGTIYFADVIDTKKYHVLDGIVDECFANGCGDSASPISKFINLYEKKESE